jgi:hypothetical protein
MQTASTAFEAELKKRIGEEIDHLRDNLAAGAAVKDYADYRYHTGQINALRRVADSYCDEVAMILNKR